MRKKILGAVLASLVLTSGAMASDGGVFLSAGYGSVSVDGNATAAPIVGLGARFGETFKQEIALEVAFTGSNSNTSSGQGNIGDAYYSLGYEIFKDVVLSGKVGYGFQQLSSDSQGNATYAGGLSYGAMAKYSISDSFDIFASYTQMSLSATGLDYPTSIAAASVSYSF